MSQLKLQIKKSLRKLIKEESYSDYLDTHYSADGQDDYNQQLDMDYNLHFLYKISEAFYAMERWDESRKYFKEYKELLRKYNGDEEEDDLPHPAE
jgi:hypothetical protein